MNKHFMAYKTIGEVAEILSSNSKNGKLIETHTIRFWEKKFKQIKPRVLDGKRRYYDTKNIELLKKVHFLLKEKGMTINGAKKALDNQEPLKLDEISNQTIKKISLKNKLSKISNIIKKLKTIK
tara:strand:+ start:1415 stop:1786 length:372 start_codon:yes stop_codon:yes gene_type:complete